MSLATGKTGASDQFAWNGFRAERLGTLGNTRVELDVEFAPGEHETSWRLFNAWVGSKEEMRRREIYGSWENVQCVTLTFENGGLIKQRMRLEMFKGRYFIGQLVGRQPALRSDYSRVGDVFWFDQMRDLGRTWKEDNRTRARDESWARGVDELRESLVGAWAAHRTSQDDKTTDFISALESLFQKVFPDITFHGVEPPEDRSKPTEDRHHEGRILGWRWTRHSIENYMLKPRIVAEALVIGESSYRDALTAVAADIAYYEAARWAIGQVCVSLPPAYELKTVPAEKEFHLPNDAELAQEHVNN